jgi:hypothetical protein
MAMQSGMLRGLKSDPTGVEPDSSAIFLFEQDLSENRFPLFADRALESRRRTPSQHGKSGQKPG